MTTAYLYPNQASPKRVLQLFGLAWLGLFISWWSIFAPVTCPKPMEVLSSIFGTWLNDGVGVEILTSYLLNIQALVISTLLAFGLSYLSRVPLFSSAIVWCRYLRFASMAGLTYVFTLAASNAHQLKLYMLCFSITAFYLDAMLDVVVAVPQEKRDLAKTLRMGPWQSLYYVEIMGTLDQALITLRSNAAMGWFMLTAVEGLVKSGGGIGVVLVNKERTFGMSDVLAIQVCIVLMGAGQDWLLGWSRTKLCPWADLRKARR